MMSCGNTLKMSLLETFSVEIRLRIFTTNAMHRKQVVM